LPNPLLIYDDVHPRMVGISDCREKAGREKKKKNKKTSFLPTKQFPVSAPSPTFAAAAEERRRREKRQSPHFPPERLNTCAHQPRRKKKEGGEGGKSGIRLSRTYRPSTLRPVPG